MPPVPLTTRRIAVLTGLTLTVVSLSTTALAAPHHDDAADGARIALEPLGTHRTGVFDASAAEIVTFHAGTDRTFVVNAESGTVDVLDAADPTEPTLETSLPLAGTESADGSTVPEGAVANSIAVREDGLAVVAVESDVKTDPGWLVLADAASLDVLGAVRVGALPDMVTLTPDGSRAVVANEGEPSEDFSVDPEGSVGVVDLPADVGVPTQDAVATADFRAWDPDGDRTLDEQVRVFGPVLDEGRRVSTNLEPEYVAVDPSGDVAYAALQEANAVAVVDLDTVRVLDVWPLGAKDHSVAGRGLDPSDRDGGVAIETWPVLGLQQPDGIESYEAGGETYLVTANEGDAREWGDYTEAVRVKDLGEDGAPGLCDDSPAAGLTADDQLGRLNVSIASGLSDDGDCIEELHAFGSRSFSIWTTDGELVFDSGEEFERVVAAVLPEHFNSNHSESNLEGRSDDKGPEPENLTIGTVGDRTYAFIGFERVGGVIAYDVTDPADASYVGYVNHRDFGVSAEEDIEAAPDDAAAREVLDAAGDLGPEGLEFVSAEDSPTGSALVVVGNEVSGTTTFFEVSELGETGPPGGGDGDDDSAGPTPAPEGDAASAEGPSGRGSGVAGARDGSALPDAGAPDLLALLAIGVLAVVGGLAAMTVRSRD